MNTLNYKIEMNYSTIDMLESSRNFGVNLLSVRSIPFEAHEISN